MYLDGSVAITIYILTSLYVTYKSRFVILNFSFPLLLRLKFTTIITGIRSVDFPFKIFISGDFARLQFIHPNHPFFQKTIQNSIIKPHADRSMSRPAIIVMVVNGSVSYFIAFFSGKFLWEKQMQCRWIKFIQQEKDT